MLCLGLLCDQTSLHKRNKLSIVLAFRPVTVISHLFATRRKTPNIQRPRLSAECFVKFQDWWLSVLFIWLAGRHVCISILLWTGCCLINLQHHLQSVSKPSHLEICAPYMWAHSAVCFVACGAVLLALFCFLAILQVTWLEHAVKSVLPNYFL